MTEKNDASVDATVDATVIYNGACPICSREIGAYKRLAEAQAAPLDFRDLNAADLGRWGLTPDQAARRLYVVQDGALISGVPAFAAIWARIPKLRWLARLVMLPGLRQIAGAVYDLALAPALYALHRRRVRRAAS